MKYGFLSMENLGKATKAVWGGEADKSFWKGASQVPVVDSVAFGYKNLEEWRAVALGQKPGHIYSRNTNPTVAVFEEKLRILEGAEAATSFSSGMAAISNTLFALLRPGDKVVSIKDSYGGTNRLFTGFLPNFQIDTKLCSTKDYDEIEAEIAKGSKILYLETPTNPTIKIVDLARLADFGHKHGAIVVVDNTFATPINQLPLQLGADLVIHSASKYLGGHADALGGIVCGSQKLVETIYQYREINGAALAPGDAYKLLRGMKTLALRVRQQNSSAMEIAEFLSRREEIHQVFYPGLPDHPGHKIAKAQMSGYGGMLSFLMKGGFEAMSNFLPRLKLAHMAANLGAVETIVGPPVTTSHVECTPQERERMGIPEGLVRYSVGIEDTEDLIADLGQALDSVQSL